MQNRDSKDLAIQLEIEGTSFEELQQLQSLSLNNGKKITELKREVEELIQKNTAFENESNK